MDIRTLDIGFLGETQVIACYLIPTSDGLILIETGPETTFENLKKAIADEGFSWREVKHVFLTHIHFDHAGAAWKFAENNATIYVHPIGLPHLENPEKLWNSAKRIYQEEMETLWGEMKPIDKKLLKSLDQGEKIQIGAIEVHTHYTPGHAVHHNSYAIDKVVFTGDVAGVKINKGPVVPPCPPPDIHIELWKKSIENLKRINPEVLYLTHFGAVENPMEHLEELERMIDDWSAWIKHYFDKGTSAEAVTPKFIAYTQDQLRDKKMSEIDIQRYEKGNPSFMSVTGLMRYWKLKAQNRI